MKKRKFVTKLILSGAALAVSAATLVSTTYAWYVQNSQVTATGISGAVKDNSASSIYISKNYKVADNSGDWLPTVVFDQNDVTNAFTTDDDNKKVYIEAVAKNEGKVYNGGLDPITHNSSGVFVDVNGSEKVTVTGATNTNAFVYTAAARVIEFNLYVQSNVDTTIRPYLIIENTTTSTTAKPQTAYKAIRNADDTANLVGQGTEFWIDAVQALRMQVQVTKKVTKNNVTSWNTTLDSNNYYDVLSVAKSSYNTTGYTNYEPVTSISGFEKTIIKEEQIKVDYYKTKDTALVSGKTYYTTDGSAYSAVGTPTVDNIANYYEKLLGANSYFYSLTGKVPAGSFYENNITLVDTESEQIGGVNNPNLNKMATTTLEKNTAYKFTFTLWLEGTDAACFDSCAEQTFNIAVNFDVEEA